MGNQHRDSDEEIRCISGQAGKGPVATHPAACLDRAGQVFLGWLVEARGGEVEVDEFREVRHDAPPLAVENAEEILEAFADRRYVERASEQPGRYRVTPAGRDAAIGYGALTLATDEHENQDFRKETIH